MFILVEIFIVSEVRTSETNLQNFIFILVRHQCLTKIKILSFTVVKERKVLRNNLRPIGLKLFLKMWIYFHKALPYENK